MSKIITKAKIKDPKKVAAGKIGGRSGSRKGVPNKRSEEVRARLEELKVDPVGFLARVVKDEMENPPLHPLVHYVKSLKSIPNEFQWKEIVALAEQGDLYASVPMEARQRAATDLLPYVYPKLKQLEVSDPDGVLDSLAFAMVEATKSVSS